MKVNIQGVNFVNKGAELMLMSILDRFKKEEIDFKYSLPLAQKFKEYKLCQELGLDGVLTINSLLKMRHAPSLFIPKILMNQMGLVDEKDIDIVLDASGFLYSDQWGVEPLIKTSFLVREWKKQGKKIIFLPQAFGPFETSESKEYMNKIIEDSDLVYARDEDSYNYLKDINTTQKIRKHSDYTVLLNGNIPTYLNTKDKFVSIIPNSRMINKTDTKVSKWYLDFLVHCTKYLNEKEIRTLFLIHEDDKDKEIAEYVIKETGLNIQIIEEKDPIKIKGIVKASFAVISSRFHGLVSSLSQSVPSIGTGWSHKYKRLFEEYISNKYLINVDSSINEIDSILDEIVSQNSREEIIKKLEKNSSRIKKETNIMWDEIFSLIMERKNN